MNVCEWVRVCVYKSKVIIYLCFQMSLFSIGLVETARFLFDCAVALGLVPVMEAPTLATYHRMLVLLLL